MNVLCATNETNASHPESARIECCFGGFDQFRMIGQPEIVICAEVQHVAAAGDANMRILRARDDPFGFKKTLLFDLVQRAGNLFCKFSDHGKTKIKIISHKVHGSRETLESTG